MTVKLYAFERKYIGLSSDTKPVTDENGTMPVGSSFYEEDTGNVAKWDGFRWSVAPLQDNRMIERLDIIIEKLQAIHDLHAAVAEAI